MKFSKCNSFHATSHFTHYSFYSFTRKLLKSQKVAITHFAIEIDTQVTHNVVDMEKVAE